MRVGGQHDARDGDRVDRAELGDRHLEVGEELQQERLELLVGAVHLVDQEDRRRGAPDRLQKRPLQQIFFREDVLLDALRVFAGALARLDGEKLALIVPLVERGVLVEALVALQADQLGLVDLRQRLGDLRLADPRLALDEQRPVQEIHQPQRSRQIAVGDVADLGEAIGDLFAGQGHARSTGFDTCSVVIAGLDPAIHSVTLATAAIVAEWMPGSSPGMTTNVDARPLRQGCYVCSPSRSAASHVRQASCGIWMWVEPRKAKASFTALEKHGTPPTLGLSPTPLAPIG